MVRARLSAPSQVESAAQLLVAVRSSDRSGELSGINGLIDRKRNRYRVGSDDDSKGGRVHDCGGEIMESRRWERGEDGEGTGLMQDWGEALVEDTGSEWKGPETLGQQWPDPRHQQWAGGDTLCCP